MHRVKSKKGQQAFSRRASRTTVSHWAGSSARPSANSVGEIRCRVTVGTARSALHSSSWASAARSSRLQATGIRTISA